MSFKMAGKANLNCHSFYSSLWLFCNYKFSVSSTKEEKQKIVGPRISQLIS